MDKCTNKDSTEPEIFGIDLAASNSHPVTVVGFWTYSLDEIKEAYWKTFHESGEWWFGMKDPPPHYDFNDEITMGYFGDFVKELTGLEWDAVHELLEKYQNE